jgi:GT2 family glycosyltransferase
VVDIGAPGAEGVSARPSVSVIVPVLNGMPWIDHQLRSLSLQAVPPEWEVVVAENGSEDGTRSCVERWSERNPRIRMIDASARPGAAAARNMGVKEARGDLLAFCDADDVVRPGWVRAMCAALGHGDLVAGVFDFGILEGDPGSPLVPAATRQLGFLPFGLGANLGVRREAFEAVGGFDEGLSPEEDVDLCWRLQLAGYRLEIAADAIVAKRERPPGLPTFRAARTYGRCGPRLYARYRAEGMRRDLEGAVKSWLWLLITVPTLVQRSRRRQWVRTLAIRSGRLAGSFRLRVFFP